MRYAVCRFGEYLKGISLHSAAALCLQDERSVAHSCGSCLLKNMLFRLNNELYFFSHSCRVRRHDNVTLSAFLILLAVYNYFHFNDKLPMNNGEHVNGFN